MKIAVMGAGALGTIIGALLTQKDADVTLITTNQEHLNALNTKGATITGKLNITITVKAIHPKEMNGIYDLVFLLVKHTQNEAALNQLLPHINSNSTICTLQNGIPEEMVSERAGKEKTIGGVISWGATMVLPRVSMLTSDPSRISFTIGEIDGEITPRIEKVTEILNLIGPTKIVNNLLGIRWSKLLMNSSFGVLSAITGGTGGEVTDNLISLKLIANLCNEAIMVSQAKGIKLEPFQGVDFYDLALSKESNFESEIEPLKKLSEPLRGLKSSMLEDLLNNRRTEIDWINGLIIKEGEKYRIKTPYNMKVVKIIKDIEEGKRIPSFNNLSL